MSTDNKGCYKACEPTKQHSDRETDSGKWSPVGGYNAAVGWLDRLTVDITQVDRTLSELSQLGRLFRSTRRAEPVSLWDTLNSTKPSHTTTWEKHRNVPHHATTWQIQAMGHFNFWLSLSLSETLSWTLKFGLRPKFKLNLVRLSLSEITYHFTFWLSLDLDQTLAQRKA